MESLALLIRSSVTITYAYGIVRSFAHRNILPQKPFAANEIVPGLWLGSIWDAHNVDALKSHNINHILTIIIGVEPSYPSQFNYLHLSARDVPEEDISPFFNPASDFIRDAITNTEVQHEPETTERPTGVLVHCMQGKSRSASLVAAYLMKEQGYSPEEAISLMQSKRPIVDPNSGFREQLQRFNEDIKQ